MAIFMKDEKLLKPKFEIVSRNEPWEIVDAYFEILEEAMLHYDLEDPRMGAALQRLQESYFWWNQFFEAED